MSEDKEPEQDEEKGDQMRYTLCLLEVMQRH
jgi:hypothetical protein